jgi:hypothetical protein
MQADREGMVDGSNLYRYAKNVPTAFTDPSGTTIYVQSLQDSAWTVSANLAVDVLQIAEFDINDHAYDFGVALTSVFGTHRQKSLSSYLKYLADPITFDFVLPGCQLIPPQSSDPNALGLFLSFDFPNGNNFQLIKMYPSNFWSYPKASHPDFMAALMLYAWAEASIFRDPAGSIDDPNIWSAKTTSVGPGDPVGVAARELALRVFPGAL